MTIGERIRDKRKQQGLTLEEVGKAVGVSKQTIQRYESGEIANIPYDKLTQIGKTLDCSPAEFFFERVETTKVINSWRKPIGLPMG